MRLRDIAIAARVELLNPMPQRPDRRYLLQKSTFVTQSFFNRLQQTGRPWAVCDNPLILTVGGGIGEYLLPVGDEFGRPLDVFTCNTGDPSFIEQQVTFYELGDKHLDWGLPNNSAYPMDNAGHSALRMSFFKKGFQNDTYVSVFPVPQTSSQYKIIYSIGEWASQMALNDSPLLAQHHAALVYKTALDSIAAAAWWADERENRMRRNELKESLSDQLPLYMKQFNDWARSLTQSRMTYRSTYAID